jgi:ketosteroid isomerase-like protein
MRQTGLLMVFVCAASLFIMGQDDSSVQSKVIALEKAWNQAYKAGDTKALDGILDDQIVLINDDGSVQTKAEFLKTVKKSDSQEQQVAPESMSVHVFGNAAIARACSVPRESRPASPTCGVSASSILGCIRAGSGCASPPMPRRSCTKGSNWFIPI